MECNKIFTDKPQFNITKEYTNAVKIEDLTEIFIVVYRVDLPNYELSQNEEEDLKKSCRYVFFTDLERALKQYKYYGPNGAVLSRIFTDNDELIAVAQKSNFTFIPEDENEEAPTEEKTITL